MCVIESLSLFKSVLNIGKRYQQAKKKPTAQIAHLVLPTLKAKTQKTKRAISCHRSQNKNETYAFLIEN